MKHKLPQLPFSEDALEPHISADLFKYHYHKHHKAYVDNLNELIVGTEYSDMPLEDIIKKASGPIYNNAAQVWNHTFFWNSLSPEPKMSDGVRSFIEKKFGSVDEFKKKFIAAAAKQFGSGWCWLTKDGIKTTSNANSILDALLVVDVWEHAYYPQFFNDRKKYLESIWNVINWSFVEENLNG